MTKHGRCGDGVGHGRKTACSLLSQFESFVNRVHNLREDMSPSLVVFDLIDTKSRQPDMTKTHEVTHLALIYNRLVCSSCQGLCDRETFTQKDLFIFSMEFLLSRSGLFRIANILRLYANVYDLFYNLSRAHIFSRSLKVIAINQLTDVPNGREYLRHCGAHRWYQTLDPWEGSSGADY